MIRNINSVLHDNKSLKFVSVNFLIALKVASTGPLPDDLIVFL